MGCWLGDAGSVVRLAFLRTGQRALTLIVLALCVPVNSDSRTFALLHQVKHNLK